MTTSMVGSGPWPITRVLIHTLWKRLFENDPSNQLYLPRIIKDGRADWGLPPYDPATPSGTSAPIVITGVPLDVADSACAEDMLPTPIASSAPTLQLKNILLQNLSVVSPSSLTFSDNDPQFTAAISVGTAEQPFTMTTNVPTIPNYLFGVGCCQPPSDTVRTCTDNRWTADASGQFVATAHGALITLVIQLNTDSTPITITVVSVTVAADPANVNVDFDVAGLPEWAQQLAQMAVQEGVGSGAITDGLSSFLNQPDVIENIEILVNQGLAHLFGEEHAGG